MTLEIAKTLKNKDIIYCVDSFNGSYSVEVTEALGYVDSITCPKVSKNFLTELHKFRGQEFYPCQNYELSYEAACRKEMTY